MTLVDKHPDRTRQAHLAFRLSQILACFVGHPQEPPSAIQQYASIYGDGTSSDTCYDNSRAHIVGVINAILLQYG